MTSPVERISGPSNVSTPGKRAKGNTASFTAMCLRAVGRRLAAIIGQCFIQRFASHDTRRNLGNRRADGLGDERAPCARRAG